MAAQPAAATDEPYTVATQRDWLFGYGSIMSEASRLSTLAAHSQAEPPPAAVVELSAEAGYVREWNFKAPSGFTAVGMRRSDAPAPVCGVLFEAAGSLSRFDAREVGYDRVELLPAQLSVLSGEDTPAAAALRSGAAHHRFWTYGAPRPPPPARNPRSCRDLPPRSPAVTSRAVPGAGSAARDEPGLGRAPDLPDVRRHLPARLPRARRRQPGGAARWTAPSVCFEDAAPSARLVAPKRLLRTPERVLSSLRPEAPLALSDDPCLTALSDDHPV